MRERKGAFGLGVKGNAVKIESHTCNKPWSTISPFPCDFSTSSLSLLQLPPSSQLQSRNDDNDQLAWRLDLLLHPLTSFLNSSPARSLFSR